MASRICLSLITSTAWSRLSMVLSRLLIRGMLVMVLLFVPMGLSYLQLTIPCSCFFDLRLLCTSSSMLMISFWRAPLSQLHCISYDPGYSFRVCCQRFGAS
jgi:hypothetical protein